MLGNPRRPSRLALNRGHPLAKHVGLAWAPMAVGAVGGVTPDVSGHLRGGTVNSGISRVVGDYGPAWSGDDGTGAYIEADGVRLTDIAPEGFSILMLVDFGTDTKFDAFSDFNGGSFPFLLRQSGTDLQVWVNFSNRITVSSNSGAHAVAVTHDGAGTTGTIRLYEDGVERGSSASTAYPSTSGANGVRVGRSGGSAGSGDSTTRVYLATVLSHVMSAREVEIWAADPWAMFRSDQTALIPATQGAAPAASDFPFHLYYAGGLV